MGSRQELSVSGVSLNLRYKPGSNRQPVVLQQKPVSASIGSQKLTLTATSGAESTATAREGLLEGDLVRCMRESAAGSGHRLPSLSESDSDPEPDP